jgi:hypothetical protein
MRPAAAQAAEWWQGAVLITLKVTWLNTGTFQEYREFNKIKFWKFHFTINTIRQHLLTVQQ